MSRPFPTYDSYEHDINLIISHFCCNDGFCAYYIARTILGSKCEYVFCSYNSFIPNVKGKNVGIFDFSFPLDVMERLIADSNSLILFDHHETSRNNISGLPNCYFDSSKSGCVLAWEFFYPKLPLPLFVQHINDYDLWKFELEGTREFVISLSLFEFDLECWKSLRNKEFVAQMINKGKLLLQYQAVLIDSICKRAVIKYFHGYKTYVVNSCILSSEVGSTLSEDNSDCVVMIWNYIHKHKKYKVALRSSEDGGPNVNELAEKYGGGGHKHASSFMYIAERNIDEIFDDAIPANTL